MRTSGTKTSPFRLTLWGPPGSYKSSFAANAPTPLFVDPSGGTTFLNVDRETVASWPEVLSLIQSFKDGKEPHQTLVLDELGALEDLRLKHFCGKAGKKDLSQFGHGQGYFGFRREYAELLTSLNELQDRGVNVIIIGHSGIEEFKNPSGPDYNRYSIQLDKKNWPALFKWSDGVFFFTKGVAASKNDDGKVIAIDSKDKVYFRYSAMFDAKNRFNMPSVLDNNREVYKKFELFKEGTEKLEELRETLKDREEFKLVRNDQDLVAFYVQLKIQGKL